MSKNSKKKEIEKGVVLDTGLLLDNSARANEEYANEAEILEHKIGKDGIRNIAVVASFGAGKSSAIETYIQKHRSDKKRRAWNWLWLRKKTKPNNTYTRISLASFNDTKYEDGDIERSILQQLLYSQPKSKLPNSRIERTTATSKLTLLLAFIITLFVATTATFAMQIGGVFL